MLRLLQETEFDRYIGFAYELALDPARSGYPTYCDGMKIKKDFIDRARKSLERPGEDVLLFIEDGEAEGVIAFEHQEGERYLHAHAFNIRRDTSTALAEFVDYCRERWPGFLLDLGFPAENVEAIGWLDGQGIPCNERSWNFLLNLDGYEPLPAPDRVKRITAENFEEFAAVHRQIQGDMFWNCERVRNTLDDWAIFVTGEGAAAGENVPPDVPPSGEEGMDHRALHHRDAPEQHPIAAISGLDARLNRIPEPAEALTNSDLEEILK